MIIYKTVWQFFYRAFYHFKFKTWCKELDELAEKQLFVEESYSRGIFGFDECWVCFEAGAPPQEVIDEELSYWND